MDVGGEMLKRWVFSGAMAGGWLACHATAERMLENCDAAITLDGALCNIGVGYVLIAAVVFMSAAIMSIIGNIYCTLISNGQDRE
jgi:hypothetical protein